MQNLGALCYEADIWPGLVFGIGTDICRWVGYGIAPAELLTEITLAKYLQADLGSAMPTSGGLYWWTHFFSSPATRNPLCFLVGYSNTLGLVGGLCSIDCRSPDISPSALGWEEGMSIVGFFLFALNFTIFDIHSTMSYW